MSIDYYVYLKNADKFSAEDFEVYCNSLGLCVVLHPSFDLLKNTGFIQIKFMDMRFAENAEDGAFLSGFELFSSEYRHIPQPEKKKGGLIGRLFKKRSDDESPFDKAIKDSTLMLEISCSSADSFEVLLAHVFGAYFVKDLCGVFDDPQTGQFYDDNKHLEDVITEILTELQEEKNKGELLTHKFVKWG